MADSTNRFFDSWTANERAALERHLKPIELQQHYVLFDIHEAVSKIVFPTSAVFSLVLPLSTGEVVETAMVGRDGAIGAAAVLNGRVSLNRAVVQISGQALQCTVEHLKEAGKAQPTIHQRLSAHEQILFAQA